MKLTLHRLHYLPTCTVGKLYIDGEDIDTWTLEDVCRESKIEDKTAIPKGTYKIIVDMSTRFKRELPLLLDVPGFTGIRIHSGNTSEDTSGCILVGTVWHGRDFIGYSRKAFDNLFDKIKASSETEIEII